MDRYAADGKKLRIIKRILFGSATISATDP